MACKITKSLLGRACDYFEAGVSQLFLANWYPMVKLTGTPPNPLVPVAGQIGYFTNTDGLITAIVLPPDEVFVEIGAAENTISYTDALVAGANNNKYRQHTANAIVTQDDIDALTEGNAISLGKFIAVPIGRNGVIKVLGRTRGLEAPAGGWDFASGAAGADAAGWTMILQGGSMEEAPIVLSATEIKPKYEIVIEA